MQRQVLYFDVRGRRCAISVDDVVAVTTAGPTTPVPRPKKGLAGLMPFRNKVLPIWDLGVLLGGTRPMMSTETESTNRTRQTIVVVEAEVPPTNTRTRAAILVERTLWVGAADVPDNDSLTQEIHDGQGKALFFEIGAALAAICDQRAETP